MGKRRNKSIPAVLDGRPPKEISEEQRLRKNAREKKRCDGLNDAFDLLRAKVDPTCGVRHKLCRYDTVCQAIDYMRFLSNQLYGPNSEAYLLQLQCDQVC